MKLTAACFLSSVFAEDSVSGKMQFLTSVDSSYHHLLDIPGIAL